jgi:antitoxin YefM
MSWSTPDDLSSMEETLAILSEPGARAELAEAEQSIIDGDVVAGADAIRALRQRDGRSAGSWPDDADQ